MTNQECVEALQDLEYNMMLLEDDPKYHEAIKIAINIISDLDKTVKFIKDTNTKVGTEL